MVGYMYFFIVFWHIYVSDIHLYNFDLFLYLNTFKKDVFIEI